MKIIESEIFKKFPEIRFGFSTKIGMDRDAPFHFNMSKSVGDDLEEVETNRKAFSGALDINNERIAYQQQIHSDIIKIVDKPGPAGECDAMITAKRDLYLAATSADCPTIFIYDNEKKIIAAVHSGWRGTAAKILEKTISKLKTEFECSCSNMFVFIAPAICQESYEVGSELLNQFEEKYIKEIDGSFYLNLITANYDMLSESGIPEENIEVSGLCSFKETGLLHSYRREGAKSGRAFGILGMKN